MIKRSEKGSITLFTLIAMMFLLTIAFTAYASAMLKLQAQNEDLERIKASYEQDITPEGLAKLYNELTGTREWLPGAGTEQNPYKIYTIEDLVEFSNRTNKTENPDNFNGKYVELMNDVDFNDVRSYENAERIDFGDVNGNGIVEGLRTELTTGAGFKPIGSTEDRAFSGNLLGNGYEIRNLYEKIEDKTGLNIGLIGTASNSNIEQLNVTGNITTKVSNSVGGMIGKVKRNGNVNISNCFNKINITSEVAQNAIGGIVGLEYGNCVFLNCNNEGKINGANNAGGMIGVVDGTVDMRQCYNNCEITSTTFVGGLIARDTSNNNSITITNSYSKGFAQGACSGGILGSISGSVDIKKTNNFMDVNSTGSYGGGIIAAINGTGNLNISDSNNIGRVVATNDVGGIIGLSQGKTVLNRCWNEGIITCRTTNSMHGLIGGIIGYIQFETGTLDILNSYNAGEIRGGTRIGGIIGANDGRSNTKIINCYNLGRMKGGKDIAGGIEGYSGNNITILNSYGSGEIEYITSLTDENKKGTMGGIVGAHGSADNCYYKENPEYNGSNLGTSMTEMQMKEKSFITTLNTNKNNINLADYDLSDYALSAWKTGIDGYPAFDW